MEQRVVEPRDEAAQVGRHVDLRAAALVVDVDRQLVEVVHVVAVRRLCICTAQHSVAVNKLRADVVGPTREIFIRERFGNKTDDELLQRKIK